MTELVEPQVAGKNTIDSIKTNYNKFVDKSKLRTSEISAVINQSELNGIAEMILEFKAKIEEFGMKREPTAREKTITRLSALPLIGGYINKAAIEMKAEAEKNKNVREILKEMFDKFKEKADYLEIVYGKAYDLRKDLLGREIEIDNFSKEVQNTLMTTNNPIEKIAAIKLGSIIEGNKLKTKEKIYNKLDFILKFVEEQLTSISLMLPGIEAGLEEDVAITSFLNNISDMNHMFKALTDLSNNVGRISAENVQGLITEVAESMDNGTDIDHLKNLAVRNQKFMTKMVETTKKKIINDTKVYNELTQISANISDNLLAYNQASTQVLLETQIHINPVAERTIDVDMDVEVIDTSARAATVGV